MGARACVPHVGSATSHPTAIPIPTPSQQNVRIHSGFLHVCTVLVGLRSRIAEVTSINHSLVQIAVVSIQLLCPVLTTKRQPETVWIQVDRVHSGFLAEFWEAKAAAKRENHINSGCHSTSRVVISGTLKLQMVNMVLDSLKGSPRSN